jgi:hypothetical protein
MLAKGSDSMYTNHRKLKLQGNKKLGQIISTSN